MTQTATSARLCAHAGAVKVLRSALAGLYTPERTTSFVPVPHSQIIDLVEDRLGNYGMKIKSEEYAIQNDGMKLFGVMVLTHQTRDDFSFAMGIRTSNDKTMAAQLIAGSQIFVCDNMVFSGEPITWRKHTANLDITNEITDGVKRAIAKFSVLDGRIEELKALPISDIEAKALVVDSVMKGVMTERLIVDVVKTYLNPPHQEFEPRTMWSLHNSYTEVFKKLRPNLAMENTVELGKMFQL